MSYCTVADVRTATGLTNTTNISDALITQYIGMGDEMINAMIGSVYLLPLSGDSAFIDNVSIQIATALLYVNEFGEENQNSNRAWDKRLKTFLNLCDQVRQLKMRLFDSSGVELTRTTTRTPAFFPTNASSDPAAINSTQPQITMDGKF